MLPPYLVVNNLVDDQDFLLLVCFGDCCCVCVVDFCCFSLFLRGRLGDGAFNGGLKVIIGV
jgi:hypothetical protein